MSVEDRLEPTEGSAREAADELAGRVLDGRYRLEAIAGRGGQGVLYRATHVYLRRTVAVKIVGHNAGGQAGFDQRFHEGATAAARIRHPNIVGVDDFGVWRGEYPYLVMEWLEGPSLRDELDRDGALPLARALAIAAQLCAALEAGHREGVLHLDVKPENILLEPGPGSPSVKLLDYGIARIAGECDREDQANMLVGTPAYLSPEQCAGSAPDARSDVYAAGCVLYEMLTGRPAFGAGAISRVLVDQISVMPQPPSTYARGISPAVEQAVMRALAKDPAARFQTAAELAAALAPAAPRGPFDTVVMERPAAPVTVPLTPVQVAPAALPRTNLPEDVTRFVGRDREVEDLRWMLAKERLLTLAGPGGSGKTRLAIRLAGVALADFPDGAWFVELAQLADPELVLQAIADVLEVRQEPGRPLAQAVNEFVGQKRMLIVLDNCEHLASACGRIVASLLRTSRNLRVLATSQVGLSVPGEALWPVGPLALPDPARASLPDEVLESEAGALFVDRARLANPRFAVTPENAAAIASICRQLDGIPLAIELAAARVRALSVSQISERLRDRFTLLSWHGRTTDLRQRTLRAAMDWSYDLLDPDERAVFGRLGVFAGGFSLEAAEAVCPDETGIDIADVVFRLVERSLLAADEVRGEARYRMLETVRQYALVRLAESGEEDAVRARHRDFFLSVVDSAAPELHRSTQAGRLATLELELGNLRAALEWSRGAGQTTELGAMAGGLVTFWCVRGHETEGRSWLEAAAEASDTLEPPLRARVLHGLGALAHLHGDLAAAEPALERALALRRETGDRRGEVESLNALGHLAQWSGDFERATSLHEEALGLARSLGDAALVADSLKHLGVDTRNRADYETSAALFRESLRHFRMIGDTREVANTLNNLGVVLAQRGELAEASELLVEHLELRRALGDRRGVAASLNNLGELARMQGDQAAAAHHYSEALDLARELGDARGIAYALESLVGAALMGGHAMQALHLAGAVMALREAAGLPLAPAESEEFDRLLEEARAAVGDLEAARALDTGRSLSLEDAIARGLRLTGRLGRIG